MFCTAAALGACGGGPARSSAPARPAARGPAPTAGALDAQLANRFRDGLYRLAVMSQPGDESADLGQPLPTGSVRATRCARAGGRAWACRIAWTTAGGRARATAYRVMVRGACFVATAQPALPPHYDSTIRAYSEHPLNVLLPLRAGC